jgi:hypothetical protein
MTGRDSAVGGSDRRPSGDRGSDFVYRIEHFTRTLTQDKIKKHLNSALSAVYLFLIADFPAVMPRRDENPAGLPRNGTQRKDLPRGWRQVRIEVNSGGGSSRGYFCQVRFWWR